MSHFLALDLTVAFECSELAVAVLRGVIDL